MMTELAGWGGYPRTTSHLVSPEQLDRGLLNDSSALIVRGQGRSYGDAAQLSSGRVVLSERADQIISFDEKTGLLEVEAGTTLAEILQSFAPRGWFPAVVPGTKFVSVGGCVAADIHGKNHHRDGAFATAVEEIELIQANGEASMCSPVLDPDLFWATVGGMGLTGIIKHVRMKLVRIPSIWIRAQNHQAKDLDSSLELLELPEFDDQYTVVWLDCLSTGRSFGRGVLFRGHHCAVDELPPGLGEPTTGQSFNLTFDFPAWLLNRFTVSAFNEAYYRSQGRQKRPFVTPYDDFLFPLDRIGNWNRLYGRRGFVQYQCLFPLETSRAGVRDVLEESRRSRRTSFLGVLKRFGSQGQGMLSFPKPGYTLTLDFPVTDPRLFDFLDRLDEIVLRHGGRIYLAKDARMKKEIFAQMYPRLSEWTAVKQRIDAENRFESDLSRRLQLRSN